MKRSTYCLVTSLLILMTATFTGGFQRSPEWVTHTSAEGRYSVLFPEQPKLTTQELTGPTEQKYTQYEAGSQDSGGRYKIKHFEHPATLVYSLAKIRENLKAVGELLSTNEITVAGAPGFESRFLIKGDPGDEYLMRVRVFIIQRRVYTLTHFVNKRVDSPAVAEKADKFFNSFKVVDGNYVNL